MKILISILFCLGLIGVPIIAILLAWSNYSSIEAGSLRKKTGIIMSCTGTAVGLALNFAPYQIDQNTRLLGTPFPIAVFEQIESGAWIDFPIIFTIPFNLAFGFMAAQLHIYLANRLEPKY